MNLMVSKIKMSLKASNIASIVSVIFLGIKLENHCVEL